MPVNPSRRSFLAVPTSLLVITLLASCAGPLAPTQPLDLVLRGGTVVDGTGSSPYEADIGIRGDRIAAIGDLGNRPALRTIAVNGLVVAPGFVDVHTHIDAAIHRRRDASNFVRMGVTTVLSGNCGSSEIDVAAHLAEVAAKPPALNYGTLLGAGSVRQRVLGLARRAPTADELATMRRLVRDGLAAGAFGLSSGLIYVPGCYAREPELMALCKEVAAAGGIYASHVRSEEEQGMKAIAEALAIGSGAGCAVHVSHLKASGRPQWGTSARILSLLQEARDQGQRVTADQYVYTASSTGLDVLFPEEELEIGRKAFADKLRSDPAFRARMAEALHETMRRAGFGDLSYAHIANAAGHAELAGKSLKECAMRLLGKDDPAAQAEAAIRIWCDAEGARVQMIYHKMCEEDVARIVKEPWIAVASDSGIHGDQGKPHPRGSGNNPRVLAKYVRENAAVPLPVAVRKMSALPAEIFGIRDRGTLREGAFADVVVFDPKTVQDQATYDDPTAAPLGMPWVIVNGVPVVADGAPTGATPGHALRHRASQ